ncbi:MAG: DHH family phosphoesterase [Oligoflexales bacterium]
MGQKYQHWLSRSNEIPQNYEDVRRIIEKNRNFQPAGQLDYGNFGLEDAYQKIRTGIQNNQRIALYADYDVDGTMSCVSWIWFFQAIGFKNYIHYIPHRQREGYGVNLSAVRYLVEEQQANIVVTMDTGITANEEAQWCRERGVDFICTDHHKIQSENMPDCIILNPQTHPDPMYQQLCGCGVTFVLLRRLGQDFEVALEVWSDLLAITAMATICDVVPLGGVNHRLVQTGVKTLMKSRRPVLRKLLEACKVQGVQEQDVGFRLGPRINAVGRLEDANAVVEAFLSEDPSELIQHMEECNEKRKVFQKRIVAEAKAQAATKSEEAIVFQGGDWHPGVVGIAAGRLADELWKPVWLFHRGADICRGSARSIPDLDVTDMMSQCKEYFVGFGGHSAAGGFSFLPENEKPLMEKLQKIGQEKKQKDIALWESRASYDCLLPDHLLDETLLETLDSLRPFGHGFEAPEFCLNAEIQKVQHYKDRKTQKPTHTALWTQSGRKIMFFHEVLDPTPGSKAQFLVQPSRNEWQGKTSVSLVAKDIQLTF